MNQPIKNVRLSFCCQENWNGMQSVGDRARFCKTCSHNVIDFTNASELEFKREKNSGQRFCGRFGLSQVSPGLAKYAAAMAIISAVSTGCSIIENPVETQPIPIHEDEKIEEPFLMGVIISDLIPDSLNQEREIEISIEPDSVR